MSSTAQALSSKEYELEELFNLDLAVLDQLLDQLQEEEEEEPPQHKLVDVNNETIASQSWDVVRSVVQWSCNGDTGFVRR